MRGREGGMMWDSRYRIESYEQLEAFLLNWGQFDDPKGEYDFIGITTLLKACVENIRTHALDAEIESLSENGFEFFTPEQKSILRRLLS
jgi:hypothetical protein